MTAEEVQELFIHAAEIDRRLPNTARPAQIKSMNMPYVFDWQDKMQWGSERLNEERIEFWDNVAKRLNPDDVTLWEKASDLVRLVGNEGQRRALLHWAMAKAGGRPFAVWCRSEGIHEETGRRRKDRAVLAVIVQNSSVEDAHNHGGAFEALLPCGAETLHIPVIINEPRSWMAEGARPLASEIDRGLQTYNWAEAQNERRRQRDAKRKREAA